MKKMLFVMNPCAGMKRANRYLPEILSTFNRAGYEVTAYITGGKGDGLRKVTESAAAADVVVCCGGDGTFNETVAGVLISGAQVPIGYIPAGSTNDFATSLGLSSNVLKAAEEIVQGTPQRFDVGSFGGRFFSYVASFGAFTRASYATSQSTKNMLGHTAYVLSGIQELSQLKTEHVRIELGDGTVLEDEFLFGAVSNSTSVGGILTLAPNQVDMADGELELLLVRAPRDIGEVTECILALQRQTYDCAMARFLRSNQVKVTASRSMDWTLDGEYQPGVEQVQIDCLRHAVAIIRKEGNK